jgi:CheY-like chemotaxis protein
MLKMLKRLIGEDIQLTWLPGKDVSPVKVDPSQIDQILANLCVNARDAITGVGKITIETGNMIFDEEYCTTHPGYIPGEYVLLAVSDNGSGMSKKTLANLFEPFFTTKEIGKGTGLGLATVHGIVMQNNGFINAYSELNQGTTFRIYLPRYWGTVEHAQSEHTAKPPLGGDETILLVEDEMALLTLTAKTLQQYGYRVLTASTPGQAISIANEYRDGIQIMVTDIIMPEMNGRDLSKKLLAINPKLKSLYMSGYTSNVIVHHGILDPGVHFIQKPFSIKEFAKKVRTILDNG